LATDNCEPTAAGCFSPWSCAAAGAPVESSALEPPWADGHKAIGAVVEQQNYGKKNYGKPIGVRANKAVLELVNDLERQSAVEVAQCTD